MSPQLDFNTNNLVPVVGTWVIPFAIYHVILSTRVTSLRVASKTFIGDQLNKKLGTATECDPLTVVIASHDRDPLTTAITCHDDFLENVPLALILATILELNGAMRLMLKEVLCLFFILRVLHVEAGLRVKGKYGTNGIGRPIGYFGSLAVVMYFAIWSGLTVLGYWGFGL